MFLFWAILGALIGYVASQKRGFSPVGGVLGGLLLGPLAVLMFFISGIASKSEQGKKCHYCAEWVKQEATVCKHCGKDISPRAIVHARHAAEAAKVTARTTAPQVAPVATTRHASIESGRRHNFIAVVGESFYQDALHSALAQYPDRTFTAIVKCEPTNKHDPNAVEVTDGKTGVTLGYLERRLAKESGALLMTLGGEFLLDARLTGGEPDKPAIGVVLDFEPLHELAVLKPKAPR